MTATITPDLTVTLTREQARSLTENGPDPSGGWCIDCHVYAPAVPTGEEGGEARLCPSCALAWTREPGFGTGDYADMDAIIVAGLNRLAARLALRKARAGWTGRPSLDDPAAPHAGWSGCDAHDARYVTDADF